MGQLLTGRWSGEPRASPAVERGPCFLSSRVPTGRTSGRLADGGSCSLLSAQRAHDFRPGAREAARVHFRHASSAGLRCGPRSQAVAAGLTARSAE